MEAPRSQSTAFFRMMAERGDFTMVHEPFSYLAEFGWADIADERVTSAAGLISVLIIPRSWLTSGSWRLAHDMPFSYCVQAGTGFRPGTLTRQPSDRPEWQPSRRWHADVAASTGFARTAARPVTDPGQDLVLSGYLRYHLPFYEKLDARRLTA